MALTYHRTLNTPSTFTTDSKTVVKTKLNNNNTLLSGNDTTIDVSLQDTFDDMFGTGIISGMVPSIVGGTLTFTVTLGAALVGVRVACAAATVTVLASQTNATLYFCQDGTWATSAPTTKSYMAYALYTSTGAALTSITVIAPQFREISKAGTAKANLNILTLTNTANAADMDGTTTSLRWRQYYYASPGAQPVDAGSILVGTETDWTSTASTQDAYMSFNVTLDGTLTERMRIISGGQVGIGVTAPTAMLHLKAGTATASTAPLKFNSGTVLTNPEAGAMEFNSDTFYLTITTGTARKIIALLDGAALTSGKIPIASTGGRLIDGQTPLSGTKVYYVADSSGGTVNRRLTFINGILTSES